MQDRTIDNALLALRRQIIRGDGENLAHVEALLRMRGVPMPRVMPAKRPDRARRNEMRRIILDALRDGPKTLQQIATLVAEKRPDAPPERAYKRASCVLDKMKLAGLVRREGRVWQRYARMPQGSDSLLEI